MARVSDDDTPGGVHGHVVGIAQVSLNRRPVVAAIGAGAVADHGTDDTRLQVDASDTLVPHVGDVKVMVRSQGETTGSTEKTAGGLLAIVYRGSPQRRCHDTGSAVVTTESPRAVAPVHRTRGISTDTGLAGIT